MDFMPKHNLVDDINDALAEVDDFEELSEALATRAKRQGRKGTAAEAILAGDLNSRPEEYWTHQHADQNYQQGIPGDKDWLKNNLFWSDPQIEAFEADLETFSDPDRQEKIRKSMADFDKKYAKDFGKKFSCDAKDIRKKK